MTNFVSLHNQTTYSILDSIIEVSALFNKAKELGMPAVGIADHGTAAAAWTALKCSKETGVKLIMGIECYFVDDASNPQGKFRHLVLIAKNAIGYRNLLTINKKGFDQGSFIGKRIYPLVDWKLLETYKEGLICLTACGNGILSQLISKGNHEEAEKALLRLKDLFGDSLGVEVQPNNMKRNANIYNDEIDQQMLNNQLMILARKHNVRIVPACNAHYLTKDDAETHDVLLAIGSHQPVYSNFRLRYPVKDFYLKTGDEVEAFFSRNYDVKYGEGFAKSLCENTIYFADMCEFPEWIDPKYSNPSGKELPIFPVKDEKDYDQFCEWVKTQDEQVKNLSEDKQYLRYIVDREFQNKITLDNISAEMVEVYKERISKELNVLETLDLSSYMLITADFLNYARKNDISVGPGRGSAGGSYIAYLLNIHCADSIKYGLVFERFHNKLKKATSDIDNDICASGRDQVIDYVVNKYGRDNVAYVSNFNTITPKVYIRDIVRACELGGDKESSVKLGNDIADTVPADIHDLTTAFTRCPLFSEYAKKYPKLEKYQAIGNLNRALSHHAAGVVIGSRPLVGLVPIRKDKDGATALEYNKDTAEENGLVKIDFLGLKTLDICDETYRLIKAAGKPMPTINYDLYDKETYDLISKGDTFCVFQFGTSGGTIDLCKQIKPKSIEDLAIITTLARPASKDIRTDFIKTREGKKEITFPHPKLKNALAATYGYPLYDESLLVLAKDIAGWDLDEADKLRKLTKMKGKDPAKAKKWREEFIQGCIKNGLNEIEGDFIWEKVVLPFGSYSFNKSHAVLYSMVSYQTAYLKAHYPIEFLLANLMAEVKSNAPDAENNIEKIKTEIRKNKVKILPPDINKSKLTYSIVNEKELLTGLDALKFVGDDAIKDIIEKRPFTSFLDFMSRVDSRKVRANTIQALISAGCFDSFDISRKNMFLYISDYRKKLQVWMKKHNPLHEEFFYPWQENNDWSIHEKYALEQFYLGEAFICKPSQAYKEFFKDDHKTVRDIKKSENKKFLSPVKCLVKDFFAFKVKKESSKFYGKPMIKATIEDKFGEQCSLTIFPDKWEEVQKRIKQINSHIEFAEGLALSFGGTCNIYEDNMGIIIKDLYDVMPPPKVPNDLKAKKINLKELKKGETSDIIIDAHKKDVNTLVSELESVLIDEGTIDLDVEENDD